MSGCPKGCPCPDYQCSDPLNRTEVLILHTEYGHVPIITNTDGKEEYDFEFTFDQGFGSLFFEKN